MPKVKKQPKGKTDQSDQAIVNLSECASKITDLIGTQPKESEDEHDQWAKLLAGKLRKLPTLQAEKVKVKIDHMVLDLMEQYIADD